MEKSKKSVKKNKGRIIKVTEEGSLGLLALGAVGLRAWRKAKSEEKTENNKSKEDEK